jgi:hypothetical protein
VFGKETKTNSGISRNKKKKKKMMMKERDQDN